MVTKKNQKALDAAAAWGKLKNTAREWIELRCRLNRYLDNESVRGAIKKRVEEIEKTTPTRDLMLAQDLIELQNSVRVTTADFEEDLERLRRSSVRRDLILLFVIATLGVSILLALRA